MEPFTQTNSTKMKRLLAILAAAALLAPVGSRADAITQMRAHLPEPMGDGFAHATGRDILVHFGQVFTYRPHADAFVGGPMDFPPPGPPGGAASAWTGRYLYTFGGYACDDQGCSSGDAIYRVDPGRDTVALMSARLPTGLALPSAVWNGVYAYVFGGYCEECGSSGDVYRYDPRLDEITPMDAVLPSPRAATYAIWSPIPTATCPVGCAYVFGGCCEGNDEIVRYEPLADQAAIASAFPSDGAGGRWSAPAVWSGRYAYVFGGVTCEGPSGECIHVHTDEIVRFDPVTEEATTERARLPAPRGGMASTWLHGAAYLIGGVSDCAYDDCDIHDDVWRYEPGLELP